MAYLAPIHRPSSVRHAIHLTFLAPDSADLIVAKANRLEIWSPTPNAPDLLSLRHIKTLYGKVTLLHRLRPATSPTDHVFVGTDRYHYFTLSWDAAAREIKTEKSYVDVAEKAARDSQTGDRVHIDPTERFMTLECYEGVVNVIPISQAGSGKGKRKATAAGIVGDLQDPIPVRIPELHVRSTCFLHKRQPGPRPSPPAFAVLQEDSMNRPRLKVRELDFAASLRPHEEPSTAVLNNAHDVQGELELGASHLIPLPPPIYGFLVVGETSVSYVEEWEYRVHHTEPLDAATVFVAWCAIDTQRYALADDYGTLYLLFVHQKPDGEYAGHVIDILGTTSRASTLVYLDSGRIFVGSHQGDSQVVRIVEKGLEVLQTFPNIAPILDFTIMDMGNRSADAPVNEFSSGQARLVTGSGAFKDGSLRSVRSGVGLENLASLGEMHGPVSGLFSLRSGRANGGTKVDTLVVSFVHVTRVFLFELSSDAEAGAGAGPEVEEVETFSGFDMGQCTLYAGNLDGGGGEDGARIVQVTSSGVVITDGDDGGMAMESWRPPQGASITAVAAEGRRFLLSLGGAVLVALEVGNNGNITVMAQREFPGKEQISCIALSSTLPDMCVVGFWHESRVAFLSLTTLDVIAAELVAVDNDVGATAAALTVPRSLVVAKLLPAQPPTLFVGLADGNVVSYVVESMQHPFTARKSMVLGTQQPNFALLPRYMHIADDEGGVGAEERFLHNVFATCEHPSLIYGNEGRVVYSAVTAEGAQGICSFDSAAFPGAIAIAVSTAAVDNDEGMVIGGRGAEVKLAVVDEERTTHVQTLPVHETVRRVAYSAELRAFGLGCIRRTLAAGEEIVESSFRLVDEVAFQELHAYALNKDELVESCMRCGLDNGAGELAERFVVGTAYLDDQEGEGKNARGRLLVFEMTEERQLKLVTELKLRGACRCLGMCEGRIVAALIKTVSWMENLSSIPDLLHICT